MLNQLASFANLTLIGFFVLVLLFLILMIFKGYRLLGMVIIPNDKVGIITKKYSLARKLPNGRIIALRGEAGIQARTLAPGLHWGYWPWQFSVSRESLINIPEGKIGVVESRDGNPIPVGHVLGRTVECDTFQDATAFLTNGGCRGPQLPIIPAGDWRINTRVFTVSKQDVLHISADKVGVVTTYEGTPLVNDDIAGPVIEGHQMYQDANAFVSNGGKKGLQTQVMLSGDFFINPEFMHVDEIDLTPVPIGSVGVVVSYVGESGPDVSGDKFTHGKLVARGHKGVWAETLPPGRYPINTRTHKVEIVPTTNIVLNWATGKSEAHNLDKTLSTIKVRSGDGFTFNLDVSQIIHVAADSAPKVIARFGTMQNLVTQVLEPTIGNYFRNSAQANDVISFLQQRTQRQQEAAAYIKAALDLYDVEAVDTLIGDIAPPDALMQTLTDRKIAEQQKVTFAVQQQSEEQRQMFEQAKSEADTRSQVVAAGRAAEVAKLSADAAIQQARGQAEAKNVNAAADANVLTITGNAEAGKIQAIGEASAKVLKLKVESMGQDNYTRMSMMESLINSHNPIVPQVVAGSSGSSTIVDALIGNLLAAKIYTEKQEHM